MQEKHQNLHGQEPNMKRNKQIVRHFEAGNGTEKNKKMQKKQKETRAAENPRGKCGGKPPECFAYAFSFTTRSAGALTPLAAKASTMLWLSSKYRSQ